MLSIVSSLCWLPVCFLWRNVSLGLLPIFESFYHEWRLNFVKCYFGICWDDHIGFVFHSLMWYITLIDWCILICPCDCGWVQLDFFSSLYSFPHILWFYVLFIFTSSCLSFCYYNCFYRIFCFYNLCTGLFKWSFILLYICLSHCDLPFQ